MMGAMNAMGGMNAMNPNNLQDMMKGMSAIDVDSQPSAPANSPRPESEDVKVTIKKSEAEPVAAAPTMQQHEVTNEQKTDVKIKVKKPGSQGKTELDPWTEAMVKEVQSKKSEPEPPAPEEPEEKQIPLGERPFGDMTKKTAFGYL